MIAALLFSLLALASAAPQYAEQAQQDLSGNQLDVLNDVFGDLGAQVLEHSEDHIVKNEVGLTAPDDYQEPSNEKLSNVPTTEVDNVFENCADYTASQGYECVPYYQCNNGTIITDGGGLIDIRNGFGILSPEDSKCPGFLDVCCKDPDFVPPPPPPVVKHVPKCGQRHQNGLGVRIQGFQEHESQFGEWPHMCAILSEEPVVEEPGYAGGEPQTVNLYQCGGSLIAPGVILTAAHCAEKFRSQPGKLKVRCGEWDTQNQTEPRAHQDRTVQTLDIHPDFNDRNLANDWALLYTIEPFELQEHIDTVCLPDPEEQFDGQNCFATGWGKDQFGAAGEYQVVLKEIDLPVVNHRQCQDSLRRTRLGRRFQLDESFICAGGIAGKDTCKGDGGSPLVCQSKGDPFTYVQAGVVAWGIGCGEDATPGVYASVSKAVCWIDYSMSCNQGRVTGDFSSYWGHSDQCQAWMDGEMSRLNQEVTAMQNADSLTGRRRAKVLASGLKAQNTLSYYSHCDVAWTPAVDLSNFGQETDSLTAGGGYSNPHPGPPAGLTVPVTEGPSSVSVPHSASQPIPQESYPDTSYEVEPSSPPASALSSQVKETVNY
jgi:kallikrein